jgi:hydroxyacylglutathione hydrolase
MHSFRVIIFLLTVFMPFSIAPASISLAHAAADAEPAPPSESAKPGAAEPSGKQTRLPEPISAVALQALITSTPGAFDLVDIRPPEQFSDYHIPGSRNVASADVLSDAGFLTGAAPLILIDKDGSQAMAIGGILSQKTERPIRVLSGGLEAFWSEIDRKTGPKTVPGSNQPGIQPPVPQPETVTPPAAPASPAKPKSAGC